jgi:hypothetical protein
MKRTRVAGLLDITVEDRAEAIRAASQDPELDRGYRTSGPVLNRLRIRDMLRTQQFDGRPFPTVRAREEQSRADARDQLWARMNELAIALASGPAELEPLAEFVRGVGPAGNAGPLAQQAVGLVFSPDYRSSPDTWAAALTLGRAAGSKNPVLHLWWSLTGRVDRARRVLAAPVGADPSAINATGISVHHIVRGLEKMRALYADAVQRELDPEDAALSCLFAPSVVRQPIASSARCPGGHPLVVLDLQVAFAATNDSDLVFLRDTWSVCPAERWVPALLAGTWIRAKHSDQ